MLINNRALHTYLNNNSSFDIRLAILKTVALLCIILAHVYPPKLIFQLRNFDVPLLVLISGALFALSAKNGTINFMAYFKKRIPRLVIPTWIFFFLFFAVTRMLFLGKHYPFSAKAIVGTFIFSEGYGWIIRVFLLLAIAAPFLLKLRRSMASDRYLVILLLTIYVLYEVTFHFYSRHPIKNSIIDYVVTGNIFYLLSYGCVFGIGMCLDKLERKRALLFAGICLFIYVSLFVLENANVILKGSGQLIFTQNFKYPPRLYYLSYALFVSFLLFSFVRSGKPQDTLRDVFFVFINTYVLEIYLWHIAFLTGWEWFISRSPFSWGGNFLVKFLSFLIILVLSICAVSLQVCVKKFSKKLYTAPTCEYKA